MATLSLEKLRQRLEIAILWMGQLESASSEKMYSVAKDLYTKIRDVYRDVVEYKKATGEEGLKELMSLSPGIEDIIMNMSQNFSRPVPEENSFDYKQHVKANILGGEIITIVRQNIIYRGEYLHNVDGNVTYHENEVLLIKQVGATPEEMRAIHLLKKAFDGELLMAKGVLNPDLSYHTADNNAGGQQIKKMERPKLEVINLEFSDTRA